MRLIDAECIWDNSICYDIECDKCSFADGEKCKLRQRIQNVCSVDAEPVRHGHWTKDGYCSICGGEQLGYVGDGCYGFLDTDYCPHCGAKMDGQGE